MADVVYTTRVKFGSAANRARVVEGLCNLLRHLEAFQSMPRSIIFSQVDGTVTVTLSRAIRADQLEHLDIDGPGA